jgi:FkbM family methyltransferase
MSLSRTLLERLSRNVVLSRRLPTDFGSLPLFVSPGSALRYWRPDLGSFDTMLFDLVRRFVRPNQTVWDIGANMGLFAFAAAHRVGPRGKVLAVEADIWCVNLLRRSRSAASNRHLPVDVLPTALSREVGIVKLNVAQRGRATNFLDDVTGSDVTGGVRETVLVPSVSLDWLLEKHSRPDFVKIDVEGAEMLALEGATTLLRNQRPVIACEVLPTNQTAVSDLLRHCDYCLFDAVTLESLSGIPWMCENIIAMPAESRDRPDLAK